jgi:hypothetical protein
LVLHGKRYAMNVPTTKGNFGSVFREAPPLTLGASRFGRQKGMPAGLNPGGKKEPGGRMWHDAACREPIVEFVAVSKLPKEA